MTRVIWCQELIHHLCQFARVQTFGNGGKSAHVVRIVLHTVDDLEAGTGSNVQREDDEDNRADRNTRQHSDRTSGE